MSRLTAPSAPSACAGRTARFIVLAALAALTVFARPGAAQSPLLTLPPVPWYIGSNLPPNLLLTLDDSGSMRFGYAPDAMANDDDPDDPDKPNAKHIAFKSDLNPIYYDPSVTYRPPPQVNGQPYETSFNRARVNGFDDSRGTVDLASAYRPDEEYNPSHKVDSPNRRPARHCDPARDLTTAGVCPGVNVRADVPTGAYWWVYRAGAAGCPRNPAPRDMIPLRPSCFTLRRPTTDDQKQNFANWYSFYRTRNLATVSAAMHGFISLPQDFRIAWQALTTDCKGENRSEPYFTATCKGWDDDRAAVDARIGPYTPAKRAALWSWLERLPASGSTPLRTALIRAGEYLKTTGPNSPYADTLGSPTTRYSSCRASYSVMMTDGVWNSDNPTDFGNAERNALATPDARYPYTPRAPFVDDNENGLADIAFKYWITDLQPSIPNNLRPFLPFAASGTATDAEFWDPRNDPATWQRMGGIFIGLGLGTLTDPVPWLGSTFAGRASEQTGYWAFQSGTAAWPQSGTNRKPGNIYDMWHAAVNARGAFYPAESADSLVKAFEDLRNRITQREIGATAASSTSLQVQTDTLMFTATFDSGRWDGQLKAFEVRDDGTPAATAKWSTDTTFPLPAPGSIGSHRVYVASGGVFTLLGPTRLGRLPTPIRRSLQQQARAIGTTEAGLVSWLLGDTSDPDLRPRRRLLGDLVNSSPMYEGGRDYGYSTTAWSDRDPTTSVPISDTYGAYVKLKNSAPGRSPVRPTVYVGSNDGMLHAFNATNGAHRWAYMPTPLIDRIGQRADPLAAHAWGVDGPVVVHDVYLNGAWRSVLVGTPGAGARGLFAIDVTNPDRPKLMWEWFPSTTDEPDLGFVLGEPVIAKAVDGPWIVAFGNGYGSVSNNAVLFTLDLATGRVLRKMPAGTTSTTQANGLSSPALLYLAGKMLGFGYAGDLLGNLWRFDLRDASPANWRLDFDAQPLFTATGPDGLRQPITAKPRIASDRQLGRMILFGTGRLLTPSDATNDAVQTLYGLRDRASGGPAQRSEMTAQTITSESGDRRTLSNTATPLSAAGWYLDLRGTATTEGERIVMPVSYLPEVSMITVSTNRPLAATDPCSTDVSSWIMVLSPFSGQAQNLIPGPVGSIRYASGQRLDGIIAPPTAIRRGTTKIRLTLNGGESGLSQIEIARGWNPRSAWQQVR